MTNLSDFLLARIAEDEEAAGRARVYGWPAVLGPDALASHIARWDPARVLAECEAKRRIVELVGDEIPHYAPLGREWEWCPKVRTADYCEGTDLVYGPDAPCECGADEQNAHGGSRIVRLLALPYASHPDYDEAWRP